MVHDRRALRGVEQPRAQADQAAGGNRERDVRVLAAAVISTSWPRRSPTSSITGPELFVRHFDDQLFERLFGLAVRARAR